MLTNNISGLLQSPEGAPHFTIIRLVEAELLRLGLEDAKQPLLDLGCGNGTFTEGFHLKDLYGVDIAMHQNGQYGHYKVTKESDAAALPFDDCFFQTVFSNCAVEHMDNLDKVLREVRRVLAPGGRFIFTVPSDRFLSLFRANPRLLEAGLATSEVLDAYNKTHHHANLFSQDEWAALLAGAGLEVAKSTYYLPDDLAQIVIFFDVLYTLKVPEVKNLLKAAEARQFRGFAGWKLNRRFKQYLDSVTRLEEGSHLCIEAVVADV